MNNMFILVQCMNLIYNEYYISGKPKNSDRLLVNRILNDKRKNNSDDEIYNNIRGLVNSMFLSNEPISADNIKKALKIILVNDPNLLTEIMLFMGRDVPYSSVKEESDSIRRQLITFSRKKSALDAISDFNYRMYKSTDNDDDTYNKELATFISTLKELSVKDNDSSVEHKFVLSTIDNDLGVLDNINSVNNSYFMSGWIELNRILDGGFKFGRFTLFSALAYNYKTTILQTLFLHTALFNKPVNRGKGRGTLLYITHEENPEEYVWFFYKYLYYYRNNSLPKKGDRPTEEIMAFIHKEMSATGFHVVAMKLPVGHSFDKLIATIDKFGEDGYDVQGVFHDYLEKTSYDGSLGVATSDYDNIKKLFETTRNYVEDKEIVYVTAHQLNSKAKEKLDDGTSSMDFVKEVAGKGFTSKNKTLDQVPDVDFTIHIGYESKKYYLTVQNSKRRGNSVFRQEDTYFKLPFIGDAPVMPNINVTINAEHGTVKATADELLLV